MSTFLKQITMLLFLALWGSKVAAQGPVRFDCPQYPSYAFFDRSCLIKTAAPYGEIRLPQGGVDGLNEERPMHLSIPTNRPTWALGIAHAWNYNRNIIQRVDHPKISYWMAITGHETGMACDCGAQWSANRTPWNSLSPAFNAKCSEGLTQHDGCFQMEEANAWCGDLNQTWPWRFQPGEHQDYISKGHFSTSCLGLAYRNILNHYLIDYAWGIDIWPIITATADPNAYEKLMASGWNSWAAGVQDNVSGTAGGGQGFNLYTSAGRAAAIASTNWDLTATASRYPEVIGWTMNVLEQNTTSTYYQYNNPIVTSTPGASQNHVSYGYYNGNITLADVNQYLTEIYLFYSELTSARMAATTANVTAVFNSLNGGAAVPFMQIGPVIDEIILGLPKEIPLMSVIHNDGLPAYNNGYRQCIGDYAPASHITNNSESDTICKGQSVILEAMIDGGDGPNMTYSWYKDGIAVSGGNQKKMVLTPSALGTFVYTVNVCNTDLGGCAPACCPKTIVVNDCNACGITANASTVNTPCQNMHGGTLNLNITGSSNYTITYESDEFGGTKTGTSSSISIANLPDGVYNITIQDNVSANCKFKLSAEVKFTTPMNEKLTASVQSMTACDAVLKTKLEQDDCECEWSVYFDTPYAAWERDVFVIITPSNGAAMRLRKDVLVNAYPRPTKATFKMCSGESIKFEVEVQPSSGSCTGVAGYNQQNAPIEVYIKDPNGVKVLNQLIPIGTAQQYQNYTAFNYVVNCPYTPGNYTYAWNPDAIAGTPANVSGLNPTTYTVVATNTANTQCTLTDTVFVPYHCLACTPPKAVMSGTKSFCVGDSAQLSVALTGTKPFKIKLSNGATKWMVSNIYANTYTFYAKNAGTYKVDSVWDATCDTTGQGSAIVNVNALPTVSLGADKILCPNGSDSLKSTTSFSSYLWSTNETSAAISVNAVGTYILQATDANGCKNKDTINLTLNPAITIGTSDSLFICPGSNITLNPMATGGAGAFTYQWSGAGSGTADSVIASAEGWYKLTVTDSKLCSNKDSIYVKENSSLLINLPDTSFCAKSFVLLSSPYSTGYNFLWSTGATTQSIVVTSAQRISLTVDDGNGCSGADSFQVSLKALPNITLIPTTASVCSGAAATIGFDYGVGYSYLWSTSETTAKINTSVGASYSIEVTNTVTSCSADTAVLVSVHAKPIMTLGNDIDTCVGSTILLQPQSPSSSLTYLWGDNSTANSLLVQNTSSYFVTVTDTFSCSAKDTIRVDFKAYPMLDLLNGQDSIRICEGETLAFNATNAGSTYLWNVQATTPIIVVDNSGSYSVKVSNGNCSAYDTVYVKEVVLPKNVLSKFINGVEASRCFEDDGPINITLDTTASEYSYLWSTGETAASIEVNGGGVFKVVLSEDKCAVSDEVKIIDYCPTSFFVPNAFTPNGDGTNNQFLAVGSNVKDFEMLIFNRWGEQIFRSTDIGTGWDGKYNSHLVQEDVYVYKILYSVNNESGVLSKKERIGSIAVIY